MTKRSSFQDIMPADIWKWRYLESQIGEVLSLFNYQEMRLAVLQDYSLLYKGMTALLDSGNLEHISTRMISLDACNPETEPVSLRPEGTINVLNHVATELAGDRIHRIFYQGPMFRLNEQKQPVEFNQLGVELLGSDSILSENEVINLGMKICEQLGLKDAWLDLSSFGCDSCRPVYYAALRTYLTEHKAELCADCYSTLYHDPLRNAHCRIEQCQKLLEHSPSIHDHLCSKCRTNFERVRKIQANLANNYKVNHKLEKNFSYYNETVFNIMLQTNGKAEILGGGGRYDYLSSHLTGKQIPAVGFYFDLDLAFRIMSARGLFHANPEPFRVYICAQSDEMEIMLLQIIQELHAKSISTLISSDQLDTEKETAHAMQNKCQAMVIVRSDNVREGKVLLKNLVKENQKYLMLSDLVPEIELIRKAVQ